MHDLEEHVIVIAGKHIYMSLEDTDMGGPSLRPVYVGAACHPQPRVTGVDC